MSHRRVGSALPAISPEEAKEILKTYIDNAKEVIPQLNGPDDAKRLEIVSKHLPNAIVMLEQLNKGIDGFDMESLKELHRIRKFNPMIAEFIVAPPPPKIESIATLFQKIENQLAQVYEGIRLSTKKEDIAFAKEINDLRVTAHGCKNKDNGLLEITGKMAKAYSEHNYANLDAHARLKDTVKMVAHACEQNPLISPADEKRLKTLMESINYNRQPVKAGEAAAPVDPRLASLAPKPK